MYIARYADDFKIFTTTRADAEKIFTASKMWLKERLKLSISPEKSKITNLKKKSSEFLGFELKMEVKDTTEWDVRTMFANPISVIKPKRGSRNSSKIR